MDFAEAEEVLRRHASAYAGWGHEQFRSLTGQEQPARASTPRGNGYTCAVEVELVHEGSEDIEVSFVVSEVGGRSWFPALVSARFCLSPGERWDGELSTVNVQNPGQAVTACGVCLLLSAGLIFGVGRLLFGAGP